MKDKKDCDNVEEGEKVENSRIWLENLDVTPSAKALLMLSYN
ncbi:MAG: hypothetical protein Q8M71_10415 [Thermodesulfovibrionales bacterium]|nr:hypothetical protein [Thermodesulfovibrionales bacterium]